MTISAAAGVDAGKDFLYVGFLPRKIEFHVPNAPAGFKRILTQLRRANISHVVLEAIGGYAHGLVRTLAANGITVGIVNPRRIKAFRDAEGKRAKNDRIDALLIARFALAMPDAIRPLPAQHHVELKALATRRRQLVEMIAMEKTRLKQTDNPLIATTIRAAIAALQAQRDVVEAEIDARVEADPELCRKRDIFRSIPGIGKQIATVLTNEMPELGTTDRRGIASLAGVAPHIQQSGRLAGSAHIGGGRPCVRAALYMAALSAVRADPKFKTAYQDMRAKGKPAKSALIAIARKLIVLANALARTNAVYDPETTVEA